MDNAFQILKDCNHKLRDLRTADYRFVAWIIYSADHNTFIAGVDSYSNDAQNAIAVIEKAIADSPLQAVFEIDKKVTEWLASGSVPLFDNTIFS